MSVKSELLLGFILWTIISVIAIAYEMHKWKKQIFFIPEGYEIQTGNLNYFHLNDTEEMPVVLIIRKKGE